MKEKRQHGGGCRRLVDFFTGTCYARLNGSASRCAGGFEAGVPATAAAEVKHIMKALVFSCGTGGGHNAAAKAMEEALTLRGHQAKVLDPYELKSARTSDTIGHTYVDMVQKTPAMMGVVYALGNAYRRLPGRSPVYRINGKMVERVAALFEAEKPDVVFMPHLFPAEILTNMKNRGLSLPKTIYIDTDYVCVPFTEETSCDAYIVPGPDLVSAFSSWGLPEEKIYPLGIPVRRCFTHAPDRSTAMTLLGLDKNRRYVLVSGGSMGVSKLQEAIDVLYGCLQKEPRYRMIVVCGSNDALRREVEARYGEDVLALGFTDQVSLYMRASDIYVTKPGGLTSTEAAAMGVPMVHVLLMRGNETVNMRYFSERGMSVPVTHIARELPKALERLTDPAEAAAMVACQHRWISTTAAEDICRLAEKMVGEEA